MSRVIDRQTMARWLTDHGFEEVPTTSGLRKFRRPGCGSLIVRGHGRADVDKKFISNILRQLTAMGFDAGEVRAELRARKWGRWSPDAHRTTAEAT